jgi:hypothetical protein
MLSPEMSSREKKMNAVRILPILAVALAATACSSSESANEQQVNAADLTANDVFLNDETAPLPADEAEAPVPVPPLPAPPADLSADEVAPLTQASEVASEIASDSTIERVPFEDGWAWRRDGHILRTVSRDGRRVSYFHPGDSTPFYVQQGDEGFAYRGGRPERAYDRRGRPAPVDARRREDARRLADQSRRAHDEARQAPTRQRQDRDRREDRTDRRDDDRDRTNRTRESDRDRGDATRDRTDRRDTTRDRTDRNEASRDRTDRYRPDQDDGTDNRQRPPRY